MYYLNHSNRPVRTRMPGGVGGAQLIMAAPYPDSWRRGRDFDRRPKFPLFPGRFLAFYTLKWIPDV